MPAENFLLRYIVHADRNTQHGTQGNQIGTYMSVADGSVVGSPVVHNIKALLKGPSFPLHLGANQVQGQV